jgi:arsenate reductase
LLTFYARGRMHASSAGEKPAAEPDATLVRVAGELDIDLAATFPKPITPEAVQVADVVILLGEATVPPLDVDWAEHHVQRWDLPTFADQSDDTIRDALVELDRHTLLLLADLLTKPTSTD